MNKKKQKKNDLRSSIILLLLLLLLLISATYAWFTANQTVKVSSIDVHIEAQNGLQISTDATTWKSIIENLDITDNAYLGNTNQLPANMEPVSTIGEVTDDDDDSDDTYDTGRMRMFYGTVDESTGTQKLSAVEQLYEGEQDTVANPDDDGKRRYVAFDVFLKVDAATDLQLGLGSNVIKTDKLDNSDKGIKQASRVAFCILGNKAAGTATSEITAITGGTTSYIWEPNSNWHTAAAKQHAANNYGVSDLLTNGSDTARSYYGIKAPIPTGSAVALTSQDANYFELVTPTYTTTSDDVGQIDAVEPIFSLQAGITKVRIYMWIEGQDYDCENTASGTDISYNLQLEVANSTT